MQRTATEEAEARPADHLSLEDVAAATPPAKPPGVTEFTFRAVIVGFVVSAVIGASYPYVVMKLGFGPNISVVSAFFGYLALGIAFRNFNRWENNIVQTAGTAGGQTAFMCVLMAAFDLLRLDTTLNFTLALTPWQSFMWLTTAGCLGVLLAVPMRRHFIIDEKLRYPDGIAVAETLIVLDSRGRQAFRSAMAMVIGTVVSAAEMLVHQLGKVHDFIPFGSWFGPKMNVGLGLSWLSFGSGMLVGMRINASMLAGTLISWVTAPLLLYEYGVIDWLFRSQGAMPERKAVLLWVMWPATGMLVAGGLAALVFRWKVLARTFKHLSSAQVDSGDFPTRWVIIGVIISATALLLVQKYSLGMPIWMTFVAILLTLPLMLVGLRVLGETNWGPISALSNLMQGFFGLLAPRNIQANMVASGVTGSIAVESEALMQDFKTGHLIGSTPRYLTYMQLMAVPVGALAVSFTYPVLRDTYGLGDTKIIAETTEQALHGSVDGTVFRPKDAPDLTQKVKRDDQIVLMSGEASAIKTVVSVESATQLTLDSPLPPGFVVGGDLRWRIERKTADGLQSPISQKWSGFAKLLSAGLEALPPGAIVGLLVGVLFGILFTGLEQIPRLKPWMPSPTGLGIGMLVPAAAIIPMFLGGLAELIWRKAHRDSNEKYMMPLASGFIAGEAIIAVVLPILIAIGILTL